MSKKSNVCIILGAGASRSLMEEEPPQLILFRTSPLPLGDELVKRIISYRKKSITWYLSYILYNLICDFKSEQQMIDFFVFAREIERYWPNNLRCIMKRRRKKKKISYFRNEFDEYLKVSVGLTEMRPKMSDTSIVKSDCF